MKVKPSRKTYAKPAEDVVKYVDSIAKATDVQLIGLLSSLDVWRFARGDLHGWIPALDRFDAALETIVKNYELDKPQLNPFTPHDRTLLLEVLRVYRLLLENCTSRKLFASYDRCYDLLCTSDLAVLQSTLVVLLRPTQQYLSDTPIDPSLKTKLRHRLLSLARGWDKLKGQGWDLLSLATRDDTPPRDPVIVTFHSAKEAVTMDLSDLPEPYADELAEKGIPIEEHYSAFVALRISFMKSKEERRQLIATRLLAMAAYVCLAREDAVNHTICLYEPEIIADICELLPPTRDVSDSVRCAALLALDGFSHHKSRLGEVLTSLNISANYGVLITLLRSIAKNEHSLDVADAMLTFVSFLVLSPSHNATLVAAGVLNILLEFLNVQENRTNYIPRACGLIDNIVFSNQQGFAIFTGIDGVNTVVARIKEEIDRPVNLTPQLVSAEGMVSWAMAPLRALLRTVQRMMQAAGGTEGLRNLVDGDLPKAIKRIFEENEKFGPRVYSIAINVMASFINNEPTSLSILQELKLPQTLYEQLEKSIPVTTDVLNSVPNAISAICLNPAGLALTNEHSKILSNLVSSSIQAGDHVSQTTGGALEELARHQPPLRDVIQKAAMDMLTSTLKEGQDFVIPPDQEHLYLLDKIPQDGKVPNESNAPIEKLSRVIQFFEGFLGNATICKDLVKGGIIDQFLSISDLPCIPNRWGTTDAAQHLSHVFRNIAVLDHIAVTERILEAVDRGLDACAELWQPNSHPIWLAFHNGEATPEQLQLFVQLRAAVIRLTYLGESFSSVSFSHARVATSLAKCLRKAPKFLAKFGALYKTAIREHAVLRQEAEIKDMDLVEAERENGKESGAKFMATRIHAVSDMFFRAAIRLLFVKRNPDGTHAGEAKKLADLIAAVLVSHLDVHVIEGKESSIRTFALGTTSLLFDERGYDGYINSLLLVAFIKKRGLDAVLRVSQELLDTNPQLVLTILSALVSSRLVESPQTAALQPAFSPTEMLVRIRAQLFPLIRQVWNADWLPSAKDDTIKLAIKAFLTVIEAKSETDVPAVANVPAVVPPPRVRAPANPALVDQLVDMGFNRGAAVAALQRAHNNIGAAAELILSAPHIYADMPEPPAAAPAPAPAALAAPEAVDVAAPSAEASAGQSPAAEADDPMDASDISTVRTALDAERTASKEGMATRGILLLDKAEDLIFQLLPAFPVGTEGVRFALDQLEGASEASLPARLRLGVIILNNYSPNVTGELRDRAHAILSSTPVQPKWTAAYLLFGETLLKLSSSITETKLGSGSAHVVSQSDFADVRQTLLVLSISLVENAESTQPDMLAAMRMLVILSRLDSTIVEKLPVILAAFAKPSPRLRDCHPLLALIIRHAFEDTATLSAVMRREILAWMTPARNKVSDITHFLRQLRQAAFRAPDVFINVVEAECTLVDPTPSTSVFHIRSKGVKETTESDPFKDKPQSGKAVFETLLGELNKAVAIVRGTGERETALTYAGLLVSLITEILGSYVPAKQSFLAVLRTSGVKGIGGLLADLVCDVSLKDTAPDAVRGFEVESRTTLSKWGSSMVIALCSDISATLDIKDLPEDLISVRKQVLDAIAKAIKESATIADLDSRYGRLHALGELTYRLLVARPVAAKQDESGTHIAKTMIEKNFVGTLTAAAGEVDLNYPEVRGVLSSLLKALEYLSKMSIKWSKSDKRKITQAEEDSSDSEDSEMDFDEEEEAPDLYRNSALARLGGGVEEDEDEDDEDEDDDMMQFGDEGDDMSDGTGSQPLTDEEDEDMGEGEGDWTDEEEELESMDGDAPVFEGEPVMDEEAEAWEGEVEESVIDDEGEEPYPEDEMYDEEGEEMMDDEGFDDFDLMDGLPEEGNIWADAPPEPMGPWGWEQPGAPRRPARAGGDEDVMSALYGGPPSRPAASAVAAHPLVAPPSAPATSRRLPRGMGGAIGLDALLRHIQHSGATEAIAAIDQITNQHRYTGGDPVRIDLTQEQDGTINLRIGSRIFRVPAGGSRPNADAPDFIPRPTTQRWQEEYSIIPGRDMSAQLVIHIINRLMPEAKRLAEEETARRDKEEAEEEKKRQEEAAKEQEERDAKTREEAKRLADELATAAAVALPPAGEDVEMEAGPSEAAATLARTVIEIHGREIDITDTGIDLEFLQALPDDMRAEVVEQHMREQTRQQRPADAPAAPQASSQINHEFLQALPPNIRAEVLMQEAVENARRNRPAAPAPAPAPVPNLLDLAGFDPGLLAGFDDLLMQGLGGLPRPRIARRGDGVPEPAPKRPHRETLQLLDKSGIAALVRLLFFPEAFRKGHLFRILVNLCENSTTRADLLNLLLSVVQDGSGDLPAVDRSFQQMSLRDVATPKMTPKLKAPETPGPIALPIFAHLQAENIPTFIAQRCFEALSYIVSANQQAVTFFLTEHEQAIGLRKAPSKKGKGKVLPQTKFPIVILLGLLDRPVLLKTNAMMESITQLLSTITRPLMNLKQDKAAEDEVEAPAVAPIPETPAANVAAVPGTGAPASSSAPAPTGASSSAAPTTLTQPPIIPPNVLRLVVNCMTTGECSSRTFGNSLMLMQNLCCIPDGKDVIVQEISSRCRELGSVIQGGLLELAGELETSSDTTMVSQFSAASSSQAQLLRLLKTIDFLHTHKSGDAEITETLSENEQKVADIFSSFRFEGMWERLGACLKVVEQSDSTEQVAVVLLPLIESLMVICKYRPNRTDRSPSAPPQSESADLFVSFTTSHRKVLNSIVRNNPSLLSGSFSLLVRNSRVLEFDNKRNWFFQKLKRKKDQHAGALHLNIRRQYVFEDSFHALQRRSGDEIKYGKLNIKFYNEDGVDAGGVTREWYSVLARQIFDPNFALFEPCAADQLTYQPNKASAVNGEHLAYFKFVGRVIGKSIYDGRLLDAYFSRAFYKQILGRDVDIRDLESIDPEYHKSLTWMLDNDITGVIDQEFTIEDDQFGEKKIVELKEGGAKIPVTEENKGEYVRLVVSYRLDNSIKEQNKAFLEGFYDVIPRHLIEIFEPDQLELLISGITTVDVDELKNATQMSGWKSTDPEIAWFWRALRSFSQEERSRFLMFVTSSSRVPLGGFTQLQGASGIQPFQIQKLYAKDGSLPQASTCFNLLLLPKYETYEHLKDRLMFAVTETGGFGKA